MRFADQSGVLGNDHIATRWTRIQQTPADGGNYRNKKPCLALLLNAVSTSDNRVDVIALTEVIGSVMDEEMMMVVIA